MSTTSEDVHWGDMIGENEAAPGQQHSAPSSRVPGAPSSKSARARNPSDNKHEPTQRTRGKPMASGRWAARGTSAGGRTPSAPSDAGAAAFPSLSSARTSTRHASGRTAPTGSSRSAGTSVPFHGVIAALREGFGFIRIIPSTVAVPGDVSFPVSDDMFFHFSQVSASETELCPGMEVSAVATYKQRKWSATNVQVASSPYAWVRRSDRSYIGVITSPARGPRTVLSAADSQLVRIAPTAWKAVLSEPEGHVDVLTAMWATRHAKGDVSRLHGKGSAAGKIRILLPSTAVQEDAGTISARTDRLLEEIVAEQARPDAWAGCSWLGRSFPWGFDGVAFDATPEAASVTTPRSTAVAASWMPGDVVRVRVATDARTGESWATDIERVASLRQAAQAFAAGHPDAVLRHRAVIKAVESAAAVVAMPKEAGTGALKIPLADLRTGEHTDAAVAAGKDAVAADIVTLHLPAAADRLQASWGSTQSAESLAAAAQEALDWSPGALARQAEGKTPGTRPMAVLLDVQLLPNAAAQTHAIAAQLPGVVLAVDPQHRGASLSLPAGALLGLSSAATAAIRSDCELSVWLSAESMGVPLDSLRVGDLFMLQDVQVRELTGKVEACSAQLLAPSPALREYGVISDRMDAFGFITPLSAARAANDVYFHSSEVLGVAASDTLAALATGHWQAAASAPAGLSPAPAWDTLKPGMLVSFETGPSPIRDGANKPVATRVQVLGTAAPKLLQTRKDWKAAAAAASKSLPKLQTVAPTVTGTVLRVDPAGTKGTADAGVLISVQLDDSAAEAITQVGSADPQQYQLPAVMSQIPLATWRLAFACGLRHFPAAESAPGAAPCPAVSAPAAEAAAVDGKPSLNAQLLSSPAVAQHDLFHAVTRAEKRGQAATSRLRATRASMGEFIVAAHGITGAAVAAASALRDAVALPSGMAVALAMAAGTGKYSHVSAGDVQQLRETGTHEAEGAEPVKLPVLEGHADTVHASLLGLPSPAAAAASTAAAISVGEVVSSIPQTASACLTPQAAAVTIACGVQPAPARQAAPAIPAGEYWVPCLRADAQTVLAPLVGDSVTAELCVQTASGKVRARNVQVTHSVAGAAWASGGAWGEANPAAGAETPALASPDAPTAGRARGIIQAIKNGVALVHPEWPIPGSTVVFPAAVPGGLGEIPPGTEIEYTPEASESGHACTDVQPLPKDTVIQQLVSEVLYIGRVVREPAIPLRGRRPFGKASAPYATGVNAVVEVVRRAAPEDGICHELAAPFCQGAALVSQAPWLCAGIQPQVQAVLDGMAPGAKLALSTQHCVAFDGCVPPLLRDDLVVFRVGVDVASTPTLALPLGDAEHIKTCCATSVQILQPMEATRRRGVILRVTEAGGTLIQIGQLPASQFVRVLAGIDKLAEQYAGHVSASTVDLAKSFLMTEQAAHYPVGDVLKFSKQHVLPSLAQAASATQQEGTPAQPRLTVGDEVDLDIIRFGAETPIRIVLRKPRHGPIPTLVHQGETGEAPPAAATAEEVLAHALHMQGVSTEGLPHTLQFHPVIVGPDVKFRRPRPAPIPGEKQGKALVMTRPRFNAKIKQRQNAANMGVVSKDAAGPPSKDAVGFDRPRTVCTPRH